MMKRNIIICISMIGLYVMSVSALRIQIPLNYENEKDLPDNISHTIESRPMLVNDILQWASEYLWFAMIVVAFALVIWIGFKLMTRTPDGEDATKIIKDGFIWLGVGVAIVLFSYVIVRLVVNIL